MFKKARRTKKNKRNKYRLKTKDKILNRSDKISDSITYGDSTL